MSPAERACLPQASANVSSTAQLNASGGSGAASGLRVSSSGKSVSGSCGSFFLVSYGDSTALEGIMSKGKRKGYEPNSFFLAPPIFERRWWVGLRMDRSRSLPPAGPLVNPWWSEKVKAEALVRFRRPEDLPAPHDGDLEADGEAALDESAGVWEGEGAWCDVSWTLGRSLVRDATEQPSRRSWHGRTGEEI